LPALRPHPPQCTFIADAEYFSNGAMMEVDPLTESGAGDTPSAGDDTIMAEKFMEVVVGLFANDITFDFISENEEEG
jgi:hypothetical protein